MVPEFAVEDLPLCRSAALVPEFAVKDLPLGRTAVEQVVACALVTQQAWVRSPVGTSFLGEVFLGFFLTCKTNVGKLSAPKVPKYHLAIIIIPNHSLRAPMT